MWRYGTREAHHTTLPSHNRCACIRLYALFSRERAGMRGDTQYKQKGQWERISPIVSQYTAAGRCLEERIGYSWTKKSQLKLKKRNHCPHGSLIFSGVKRIRHTTFGAKSFMKCEAFPTLPTAFRTSVKRFLKTSPKWGEITRSIASLSVAVGRILRTVLKMSEP